MHSDQCTMFLRDILASKLNIHHSAQRYKPPTSYLFFFFNYNLLIEGKDGLFCLLSFFFFFLHNGVNRWSWKSSNLRWNKRKTKAPRFWPRKRSQSIIIYSHCIAQDHSHTHTYTSYKDYFRLWDYKIKVWKTWLWFVFLTSSSTFISALLDTSVLCEILLYCVVYKSFVSFTYLSQCL